MDGQKTMNTADHNIKEFCAWLERFYPRPAFTEFNLKSDHAVALREWQAMKTGTLLGFLMGTLLSEPE